MSIQEYLKSDSKASSMRLGFIISVWFACAGGFILAILDICINEGKNLLGVAAVIGVIQGFAFGGKTFSGKFEKEKQVNQ